MVGDAPESERPEPRDLYRKLVLLTGIRLLVGTALLVATALLSLGSEAFPGGIEVHLYAIIGGIYVVEAVSVIVQVASFKLTGRRVFRMAPLHHHYELTGWPEPKIVVRFWIVSFALALLALTTLKLR